MTNDLAIRILNGDILGTTEQTHEAVAIAVKALSALPSADVQTVRHGHWIPKFGGEFKGGAYWYDCSECGHTVAGGILSGNNFCKNCGARMDKER